MSLYNTKVLIVRARRQRCKRFGFSNGASSCMFTGGSTLSTNYGASASEFFCAPATFWWAFPQIILIDESHKIINDKVGMHSRVPNLEVIWIAFILVHSLFYMCLWVYVVMSYILHELQKMQRNQYITVMCIYFHTKYRSFVLIILNKRERKVQYVFTWALVVQNFWYWKL